MLPNLPANYWLVNSTIVRLLATKRQQETNKSSARFCLVTLFILVWIENYQLQFQ